MKKMLGLCFAMALYFALSPYAYSTEVTLYANFASGDPTAAEPDRIKTKKVSLEAVTVEAIAKALSEWSGLDFTLNSVTMKDNQITVDWSAKSTLIANLDNRKQKEEFHFFDADSLRWFMMDSLYDSIVANFNIETVHYTTDNGKDITFEGLIYMNTFPANAPYMGSTFYSAHNDVVGDGM